MRKYQVFTCVVFPLIDNALSDVFQKRHKINLTIRFKLCCQPGLPLKFCNISPVREFVNKRQCRIDNG